jgi:hypothetical protein
MNRGSCLCGAVQFESGPFDSMVHCHCSMCRKHHGAMFATFLTAPREGFRWLAGEDEIVVYRSSQRGLRPFCRICGSVVPSLLPDWPSILFVPAGNLEADPGRRPELHMFVASRAPWFPITDSLPQHAAFPPQFGDGETVDNPPPKPRPGVMQGRCLCGDIAWELAGPPELAQNCHCSRCRRARSAAHATNAFFKREQLTWTRGEDKLTSYALPGAKRFGQDFCRRCGSPVPRVVTSTGYVVVPCGSLDSPLEKGPRGHIFTGSKAPWFEITGSLPQWETLPA